MATAAQVAEFRQANQSLVLLAQRDLREFWGALNLAGDPYRVRSAVLEFFPELLAAYGDAAALLGADFYDALRDVPVSAASFQAAMSRPVPVEQAQGSARWALGAMFLDEPRADEALRLLLGSTQRLVLQPGRDTVWESARRDPVRTGVARVPSGPTTCKFCTMLASRGAVYPSLEAAGGVTGRGVDASVTAGRSGGQGRGVRARGAQDLGKKYHDDCDCVPTVIRSRDDYPEGHDLKLFRKLYAEDQGIGRDIPTD